MQRGVLLELGLAFADVLQIAGELIFLHEMVLGEHPVLLQPQEAVLLLLLDGRLFWWFLLAAGRALAAHLEDPFECSKLTTAALNYSFNFGNSVGERRSAGLRPSLSRRSITQTTR